MTPRDFTHARHCYLEGPEATALHIVDVWIPSLAEGSSSAKKWVIYIHGGAWRDPGVDSMSFEPTFEILSGLPIQTSISGFASVSYRLSPYPDNAANPSSSDDPSRNAKHPDHLQDVSRALAFLERQYKISDGYLLVGHSAGATLAFQLLEQSANTIIPLPLGVLGVGGIYDIPELVASHERIPEYRKFITHAFGPDEKLWRKVSPSYSEIPAAWMKATAIIIAHSNEDELVDGRQAELMVGRIRNMPELKDRFHYFKACGLHNNIWKDGHELGRLVEKALAMI